MLPPDASNLKLDDILDFNEQLLLLERASLPIAIDESAMAQPLAARLAHISSQVALQIGRGRSLSDALDDRALIPARYRLALNTWKATDRDPAALEILTRPAEAHASQRADVGFVIMQPMILLSLVYAGLLFLVWRNAPILERLLRESRAELGPFLRSLQWLRRTEFVWVPALPLLLLLAIYIWLSRSPRWKFGWVPGSLMARRSIDNATFTDGLASCLDAGLTVDAAQKQLTGALDRVEATGPQRPSAAHAAAGVRVATQAGDGPSPVVPVLVAWALEQADSSTAHVALLRNIARAYRGKAKALANRWRRLLPILIGTLLGGLIVLFYGLMLFGPILELLLEICQPKKFG